MKKNPSRVISLFGAILLVVSILVIPATANGEIPSNVLPTTEDVSGGIEEEAAAIDAYGKLLSNFQRDQNGQYIYPDSFSGAYLNAQDKLCIKLYNYSQETIAQYSQYTGNSSCVCFEKAEYSYNMLTDIMDTVIPEIKNSEQNVSCIYIDEMENVIKIGTNNPIMSANKISEENLPIDYYFEEPSSTAIDMSGGDGVYGYTIGLCGTYHNQDALLLCGHGLSVGSTLSFTNGGSAIATVVAQRYQSDNLYDYAIATVNSGSGITLTNHVYNASNYTSITSLSSTLPLTGSTLCKYGKHTGFGTVTVASNNTVWYPASTSMAIYGMVRCNELNGGSTIHGDSGGPVYAGHVFYGTISSTSSSSTALMVSPSAAVSSMFAVTAN